MRRHDGTRLPRAVAPPIAVLVLVISACGSDDDPAAIPVSGGPTSTDTTRSTGAGAHGIEVNAQDIAFDLDRIDVTAGEAVTVTFNNNDTGIPHNFHIQAGQVDAKTDIAPGPDTQTLEFTIDEAGSYTFICDVHPDMTGELVAS
jgi:plastocyanin